MSKEIVKFCKERKVSPNQIITLYLLTFSSYQFDNLFAKEEMEFLETSLFKADYINEKGIITAKGKRLVVDYNELFGSVSNKKNHLDESVLEAKVSNFIDKYRLLFKGKKPGAMGDKNSCKFKMIKFLKEYPQYADQEIILKATQKYIHSVNDYTYLKRADYFIFKESNDKIRASMLASYCEELDLNNLEDDGEFIKEDMI